MKEHTSIKLATIFLGMVFIIIAIITVIHAQRISHNWDIIVLNEQRTHDDIKKLEEWIKVIEKQNGIVHEGKIGDYGFTRSYGKYEYTWIINNLTARLTDINSLLTIAELDSLFDKKVRNKYDKDVKMHRRTEKQILLSIEKLLKEKK